MTKLLSEASGDDLHRSFSGHPSPRKSKPVVGFISGDADPIYWLTRTRLAKSLKLAGTNKRLQTLAKARNKRFAKVEAKVCVRRWLEFASNGRFANLLKFAYASKPKLILREPRFVYEVSVATIPVISFTDSGEALDTCLALQTNGLASAEIKMIDLGYSHTPGEKANVYTSRRV